MDWETEAHKGSRQNFQKGSLTLCALIPGCLTRCLQLNTLTLRDLKWANISENLAASDKPKVTWDSGRNKSRTQCGSWPLGICLGPYITNLPLISHPMLCPIFLRHDQVSFNVIDVSRFLVRQSVSFTPTA